ncbi:RING finger protein 17 isoform X2 [Engystomops pustulosus]
MDSLTIMCPMCEEAEPEDCEIICSPEDLSIQSRNPAQLSPMERTPASPIPTLEEKIVTLSMSSGESSPSACSFPLMELCERSFDMDKEMAVGCKSEVTHLIDENAISSISKDYLYLAINEALVIANSTLYKLNSSLQTFKDLDVKNKMLEKRIASTIHDTFGKILIALKKRKSELLTDLRSITEMYTRELQTAVKNTERQKKSLETRVAFAEGLKQSPLLTMYCNLNQLVTDLKINLHNEDAFKSLKESPDIRFALDSTTILKSFDDLGTIYCVSRSKHHSTPNAHATLKEPLHINNKPQSGNLGVYLKDCIKDLSLEQGEFDFRCMKRDNHEMDTTSQVVGNYPSAFQGLHSLSSPDVIIEEIIEEDQPCLFEAENNIALDCSKVKHLKKESGDCKPKRFKKSQKMTGACAPFCQKKTPLELVYLKTVINPCNFYIHRFTQKRQIILLERMLTTLSRKCSHCCRTDVLELGEIIAFNSFAHNKWCRGSIMELVPLESKCILKPCGPTRYKIEDITRLTIFLLDYGGLETFTAARFAGGHPPQSDPAVVLETSVADLHRRLIKLSSSQEESIRFMPPFGILCSLDLVPRSPDGLWRKEVKEHILRVVGNKGVSMKILREEHNKLIVDLKKPVGNKINSDMPVSLRDALVFLEMAKFPSNVPIVISDPLVTQYKDALFPESTDEICVIICHMNNPSDFYIHLLGESDYRETVDKIKEVYNNVEANDWKIVCPFMGQPCVAKYEEDDDQWYRAEIVGLPNTQEATISYVDFGNVATVNIEDLRSLKDEFMKLPRKAIGCRLAYIQPPEPGPWSLEANKLFEALTVGRHLKCTAIGVLLDDKLSVELFHVGPGNMTSVNTMLVEQNVASFIQSGPSSLPDYHPLPLKEVWDPVTELLLDYEESPMDFVPLSERKGFEVFVSHVVSPSKIFVQWLTSENILKSLHANMLKLYENSKPEAMEWKVDMRVAVELQSDKKWMRGKITNIVSDSQVEVIFYDYGKQQVTEVTNLRPLDESLAVYGIMCLECSLMDIQPAGGSQNWTATACDFLSGYLGGATVTMILEDDNTSYWPLPVKIMSKNEEHQLVDISEFLVKRGLALRDRKRVNSSSSSSEINDKSTKLSDKTCPSEQEPVKDLSCESEAECPATRSQQNNTAEPVMERVVEEPYLPPLLPNDKTFSAKVSHIAEDGTLYVIQECLENELAMLTLEIQNSFKCLGLLAPYSWQKGEGCLVNGFDSMLYRGKVLDILGGDMITVQYEDYGITEKLPKCHLYPSVYNPHIPRFCIPCQLNDILPVGDHWQPDAIQLLKELLSERIVTIRVVESPDDSRGIASVHIYCGGASVSAILELYNHGIRVGCEKNNNAEMNCSIDIPLEKIWKNDFEDLLKNDMETPLLPMYSTEALPPPGELCKVKVTHLETPDIVWICILQKCHSDASGDDVCDPLTSIRDKVNSEVNELRHVTDFRTAMPCLAVYTDGLIHRAKLQSIKSYDPVTCVVEFVDYGSTKVLDTSGIFQLPLSLIEYPAKAIKVKLAGFKPPKEDFETQRVPYCPKWSMRALTEMMDLVAEKTFSVACIAGSEKTVFLYNDNQQLVHKPLVTLGLADLEDK